MKRTLNLLCLCLLVSSFCLRGNAHACIASDYLPLATGNAWNYNGVPGYSTSAGETFSVLGETPFIFYQPKDYGDGNRVTDHWLLTSDSNGIRLFGGDGNSPPEPLVLLGNSFEDGDITVSLSQLPSQVHCCCSEAAFWALPESTEEKNS